MSLERGKITFNSVHSKVSGSLGLFLCVCVCANDRLGCGLLHFFQTPWWFLPSHDLLPDFCFPSPQAWFPPLWRFCFTKSVPHSCQLECFLETTISSQWMETGWNGVDSDFPHAYEHWFIIYLHFAYAFSNQALLPANIKSPWLWLPGCLLIANVLWSFLSRIITLHIFFTKIHRTEKSNKIGGN